MRGEGGKEERGSLSLNRVCINVSVISKLKSRGDGQYITGSVQ